MHCRLMLQQNRSNMLESALLMLSYHIANYILKRHTCTLMHSNTKENYSHMTQVALVAQRHTHT